ncbi:MAG: molybdopterin-dependent oxidoreductase [Acidimicrobiales bacterium]
MSTPVSDTESPDTESADTAPARRPRASVPAAAAAGIVAGLVALGLAELVAGFTRRWRSPVLDVGDRVIDRVPSWMKDLAIDWFGTKDKLALLVGIGVLLAGYAALVGVVALRRSIRVGLGALGVFGAIGVWAALGRRVEVPVSVVTPSVVGTIAGCAALYGLWRISEPGTANRPTDDSGRRTFLVGMGALAATAGALAVAGRWLQGRFSAAASRAEVVLPRPLRTLDAPDPGVAVGVDGVTPFITPNDDFYRIDIALTVPQVPADTWRLRVHGMVERPYEITFAELLERELIETDITMTCVSNEVGGGLVGNARWLGARLDALLDEARVLPEADQVVGRSVDGWECGFPVEAATDGRDAIVAVGMNGEPLPLAHGFPARLVVPGLYGYVSATKWLTEIELTTFDAFDHYWERRGWAREGPIRTQSRIDTPRGLQRVAPGVVPVAGVAWAQTRGIAAVEVQVDDGPWMEAELADALNDTTWRQWVWRWNASPGRHTLRCRATDGTGAIQTADRSEPIPDGATGHHEVVVLVEDPT